jgi:hypothetical protein
MTKPTLYNRFKKRVRSSDSIGKANFFLHNIGVLYTFVLISLSFLLYSAYSGNFTAIVFFILTGLIVQFYSKNMITIMFVSLVVTFVFIIGFQEITTEGFEEEGDAAAAAPITTGADLKKSVKQFIAAAKKGQETDNSGAAEATAPAKKRQTPTATPAKTIGLGDVIFNSNENPASNIQRIHEQTQELLSVQNKIIEDVEKLKPMVKMISAFNDKMTDITDKYKATLAASS